MLILRRVKYVEASKMTDSHFLVYNYTEEKSFCQGKRLSGL